MQALERLLDLVPEQGFILVNDYGQTQRSQKEEFEHQRFSLATFVGVNFPLLKAYFEDVVKATWLEPHGEETGIHTRLLARRVPSPVRLRFQEQFSQGAQEKLREPLVKARQCTQVGRFELAATYYSQALKEQPRNWVLLNEVAMFLTFSLRDPKAGMDMAKVALALNPSLSAELWNTLGDALFEFGRTAEARSAYQKALQVNESDVRARFNLAWVHARENHCAAALQVIAEALSLDKTGEYRERLLQKQAAVLSQLTTRNQQEYLRLLNLVSKYAKPEDKDKPKADRSADPEGQRDNVENPHGRPGETR